MFTGIIEEIGTIKNVRRGSRSVELEVRAAKVLTDLKVGDSICTNGVCLTVKTFDDSVFRADVMPETMQRSNLGLLSAGDPVNLERALTLQSRLGGHMVSGHIDGTGTVRNKYRDENAIWMTIDAPAGILRYIIEKGSIAIDGISLTVASVDDTSFKVSLIPHTQGETTLVGKQPGERVNLENDLIGKYVERLLASSGTGGPRKSGLTFDFLTENGF